MYTSCLIPINKFNHQFTVGSMPADHCQITTVVVRFGCLEACPQWFLTWNGVVNLCYINSQVMSINPKLFLSWQPSISLPTLTNVLAISFPPSLLFLYLPRPMFYAFLTCHPPISLPTLTDVPSISFPPRTLFIYLPSPIFIYFFHAIQLFLFLPCLMF